MSEYIIIDLNIEEYDKLILCLSSESLFTYITKIENAFARNHTSGKILFDQLLITGECESIHELRLFGRKIRFRNNAYS